MQIYLPIAEVSVNVFLLFGLGGLVGILSGMFGVGGGFLMTPLLFFHRHSTSRRGCDWRQPDRGFFCFSVVLAHLKRKTVDLRMGTVLLIGGLFGAALGCACSTTCARLDKSICWFNFAMLSSLGQLVP